MSPAGRGEKDGEWENPWRRLDPHADQLICPGDQPGVEAFQSKYGDRPRVRLHLDLIPEPFLGDLRSCRLVILMANPGFSDDGAHAHADPAFRESSLASLREEPRGYPLFLLDPRFEQTPGGRYWNRRLSRFIAATRDSLGSDEEEARRVVSERIAIAELHGYHSVGHTYPKELQGLASTAFTVSRLKSAIGRGAQLLVARCYSQWERLLGGMPGGVLVPRSAQASGAIGPGNLLEASSITRLPSLVD